MFRCVKASTNFQTRIITQWAFINHSRNVPIMHLISFMHALLLILDKIMQTRLTWHIYKFLSCQCSFNVVLGHSSRTPLNPELQLTLLHKLTSSVEAQEWVADEVGEQMDWGLILLQQTLRHCGPRGSLNPPRPASFSGTVA